MKRLLPSLALATASLLLSLAALEVGLRAADFDPLRKVREGRELVSEAGHRILARALERWIAAHFEPGGAAASPSGESS